MSVDQATGVYKSGSMDLFDDSRPYFLNDKQNDTSKTAGSHHVPFPLQGFKIKVMPCVDLAFREKFGSQVMV